MYRFVQKFGGSSLKDTDAIAHAARRVATYLQEKQADQNTVKGIVVVSAMAGMTDRLIDYTQAFPNAQARRDYDVVVASGEQITSGLMALALNHIGVKAVSLQGWQIPLLTDDAYNRARITALPTETLDETWQTYDIIVVPGFQGVSKKGSITTLGRGGSDTTAVALAAAVKADACTIYTDVDAILTTDPRIEKKAQPLRQITYNEMLELASLGAKVLQTRSVELAMTYAVPLRLRSTFTEHEGTAILPEKDIMEHAVIRAISLDKNEAKVTLLKVEDRPGIAARIFNPISAQHISVDMIVQNISADGKTTDLTFTVHKQDLATCTQIIKDTQSLVYTDIITDAHVAKVSLVGIGMRSHAGIASKIFSTLAEQAINIQVISTSEIKISLLIEEKHGDKAVRALHKAFHLETAAS